MSDHLHGRLPGVIGGDRLWSFSFVDDVARAHVAALTVKQPRRDYVVGGENAPQRAIFDYLARTRNLPPPRRVPYSVAVVAALFDEACGHDPSSGAHADAWGRRNLPPRLVARKQSGA